MIGDGIFRFNSTQKRAFIKRYDDARSNLDIVKFVPASGAATRMFKNLFKWVEGPIFHEAEIHSFFEKAEQFPFFDSWMNAANENDIETFHTGLEAKVKWLNLLVSDSGMNYARLPKGLLKFHKYSDQIETPVSEHLKETKSYGTEDNLRIHFTVSEEHLTNFKKEVSQLTSEERFSGNWEIGYSSQSPSTNTVFVDTNDRLMTEGNAPLTRPGGHGSLIHNLNAIHADLIFIKNIDNVCHERLLSITNSNKKLLGGTLLELREDLGKILRDLQKGLIDQSTLDKIQEKWRLRIPNESHALRSFLNRPIRVCGMVKNEGEPGGGPFWCFDDKYKESLQIVEQAQIDRSNLNQRQILENSTHFNPVDIVCCTKDLAGQDIDLQGFIDKDQYFVSTKNHLETEIKVLEWPGLWNGAMADWTTVFVEVPPATFNPVKVVSDLLNSNHLD